VRRALIELLAKLVLLISRLGAFLSTGLVGAMRREQRDRAIQAFWDQDFGKTWDTLYEWERDFYLKHLTAGSQVLLVGCGGGRDLVGLSRHGFLVDGIDVAPGVVDACRKKLGELGIAGRVYGARVEDVRFETVYDAAVFTWQGYGLIPERAERIRTLQAIAGAVRNGGRILLTYRPARGPSRGARLAQLTAQLSASGWIPDPTDTIELSCGVSGLALYLEHCFAPAEIVSEAQAAGLRVSWHELDDLARLVLEV
jgi:SAM-dependent methyltransferase